MNELALYNYDAAPLTVAPIPRTGNYTICAPGGAPATLKRGIDFGMIRKKNGDAMTKNPTLFKSGAEKVAVAYGLCQRYTLESKLEDIEHGFFYFLVRCDLIKINDGKEYIITSAYGSGNTREGRTGSQSPYDGANSAIKMAQKRALVSAALSLGCVSDMFTQDIESDTEDGEVYFKSKDPEAPITRDQVRFFYSRGSRLGLTTAEMKKTLKSLGYDSASKVLSKDFDALLDALEPKENA